MCGFFAVYNNKKKIKSSLKSLNSAANLLKHRGPDKAGTYSNPHLFCKFFRLKILDLSDHAMQPMTDINKNYLLIFNGEIYNFKDLNSSHLSDKKFNLNSDTSTLFNMLIKYKEKALNYIDGMFSFVFFDLKKKKIIFARDRFGIKPLYYKYEKNNFIFSSEIKPILKFENDKTINQRAVIDFFLKGSMDHDEKTFFKSVKSLCPGQYGVIKKNELKINKYWSLINKKIKIKSEDDTAKNLKDLFDKSINKHILSDRKIGLFLSGGADSTALAFMLAKRLKGNFSTYTYGFKNDKKFSEIKKAKLTINNLNVNNTSSEITAKYIINNMEKMVNILESPFTSIRLFGVDALYSHLKNRETKVILEGDGGDELFGGYDYNFLPFLLGKHKTNTNKIISDLFKFAKLKKSRFIDQFVLIKNLLISNTYQYGSTSDGTPSINVDLFDKDFLNENLDENFYMEKLAKETDTISKLKKSQYMDIYSIKLPRALKYKDRISMHYGIESRIPFLDHHFAGESFNLNDKFKIKNFNTRFIFKNILKKITKNKIKFNKTKFSIADPQTYWMANNLKEFVYDNLNSSHFRKIDLFNHKNIIKNYEEFCKKKKNNSSYQLFQILTFINFCKHFKSYN